MSLNGHLRLLLYGPEMIHVESRPIHRADYDELPELMKYMETVMRRCNGIGLAAPQVGVFKNFCIVQTGDGITGLVNPEVTQMFGKEDWAPEGCLSIPPVGNECPVPRMECVMIQAATIAAPDVKQHFKFSRMDARVAQHELDHLTGTFFVDRVGEKQKRLVLEKFRNWKTIWEAQGKPFPY
jgi:peptide deformylase